MAEVYAGFSEYTDAQVGRIIDYLEETGQLENTIVMYCADNGASGEGSPDGTVNENKFFNAYPDDIEQNLARCSTSSARRRRTTTTRPAGPRAFSTPFKMFKRYTYQGGVADPLVISWPKGIKARGEVRTQYHHAVDVVPTILECVGLEIPDQVQGYAQTELPGVSMRYSFDADGPTQKNIQYYEMFGTRALWHDGWHVVAQRAPQQGAHRRGLRQRHLGALPLRGGPGRGARPGCRVPGEGAGAGQPLVRRGRQVRRAADWTTGRSRTCIREMPVAEVPEGGIYRYYAEHLAGAGVRGRGDPGPVVQDPGRGGADRSTTPRG